MLHFQKFVVLISVLITNFDLVQSDVRCRNTNTVGYFPKCDCEGENYGYSFEDKECKLMCPSISEGQYPNCKCRYGGTYDKVKNSCPNPKCPEASTADSIYPNCKCTGKNYDYNEYLNECYLSCPEDSAGYFPNCKCHEQMKGFNKGKWIKRTAFSERKKIIFFLAKDLNLSSSLFLFYFSTLIFIKFSLFCCYLHKRIKFLLISVHNFITELFKCMQCPEESTPGSIYPSCKPLNQNATYIPLLNDFKVCHSGSRGKYPDCTCDNGNGER